MKHDKRNLPLLVCMGMPKCGTTTLAHLLDQQSALSVHTQKEPNDLLEVPLGEELPLAGYRITESTRFLVDFSTIYGMASNRDRSFEFLRAAGLIGRTKAIVCLRNGAGLAESFFRHMVTRRGYDPDADAEKIRSEIADTLDYREALRDVGQALGEENVFVTKLEDLKDHEGQTRTLRKICDWLGVEMEKVQSSAALNAHGTARRFHPALHDLMMRLRRSSVVKSLPPSVRKSGARLLTRPAGTTDAAFDLASWTDARTLRDSDALYDRLRTGPLAEQTDLDVVLHDPARSERHQP